jgi:hypothetical protein
MDPKRPAKVNHFGSLLAGSSKRCTTIGLVSPLGGWGVYQFSEMSKVKRETKNAGRKKANVNVDIRFRGLNKKIIPVL